MRTLLAVSLVAILATACSKKEEYVAQESVGATAPAVAPAANAGGAASTDSDPAAPTPSPALIAYDYTYSLGAPQAQVRGLITRHETACRAAGAAVCQVTGSNLSAEGEHELQAKLELRATPEWVARFRNGLAADVAKSGGHVIRSGVESEDLSRTIIDTGARVRALTALRDRLQNLLATRPGKLGELIEIERELARVQGEIDAAQSQLNYAQGRVATSTVTLIYESRDVLEGRGLWSPIGEAFSDFVGLIIGVVAFLIRLLAVLLPLGLVAAAALWLARKPMRRALAERRRRREEEETPERPTAP